MSFRFKTSESYKQMMYCLTIGALLSYMPLINFINNVFNTVFRFGTTLDTLSCYVLLWFLILSSVLFIYKHIKRDISMIFIGLLVTWFISYGFLTGADNPELFFSAWRDISGNPFYVLFVYAFLGYAFTRYITDYDLLLRVLTDFSIVVVICSTLSFFMTLSSDFQAQYMVFSYNMTMQAVFLFLYYFEKRKPLYLIVGILGFVMILMAGCRGASVCVVGCLLLYALFGKMRPSRKVLLITVLTMSAAIVFLYFYEILEYLTEVAENWNINSRTLKLIQDGEFLNDSGRNEIQQQIVEKLDVFGYGMYGDRALNKSKTYSHHLFLELICDYGYILGSALIVAIVVLIIKGLFSKNPKIRFLVVVMMSTGFFKLFLSGSYLNQEPAFYVLLGLCANSIIERKKLR